MSGIVKNSRSTDEAPRSAASTQTVAFSHYNNISAQLPVDPESGSIVAGGVKEQTAQCLENIRAIVESIDHLMTDVVRVNVYLKNITDLDAVDEIYASFFQSYYPTRTALAVAALPLEGALVQMDAVITNGEGSGTQAPADLVKLVRDGANAPRSSISSQSVAFSHYNHVSAQLPVDPATGNISVGGIKEQTRQCLKNIKAILESMDVPFDNIVKTNIHLKDMSDLEAVDEVYSCFFPDSAIARTVGYVPARAVVAAEGLPLDSLIQIDATIAHGDGTPPQLVEDRHGIVIRPNNTDKAPRSALSTQTVAFSHYNNITAQLPLDADSGKVVSGGAKEQAAQCLNNIRAIVESVGHVMDDIVKINVQLKDMKDLDAVNQAYKGFFTGDLPARTVIGVSAMPMDAVVQMDAIVSNGEGTPPER